MKGQATHKSTWVVWCTGIVVTAFWVAVLFWVRSIPQMTVQAAIPATAHLRPSGFFSDEPNDSGQPSSRSSSLDAGLGTPSLDEELGLWDHFEESLGTNVQAKTWEFLDPNQVLMRGQSVFDRERGVWTETHLTRDTDKKRSWIKAVGGYAGPRGMSRRYTSDLGRFQWDQSICYYPESETRVMIFYDGRLRQLFRLDFRAMTVTPGTILSTVNRVVQIGLTLQKNPKLIYSPRLDRPQKPIAPEEVNDYDPKDVFVASRGRDGDLQDMVWLGGDVRLGATLHPPLVLTSRGFIHELNTETARLGTVLDRLPKLTSDTIKEDYLAYKVLPVTIDQRFAGIIVIAAPRDTRRIYLQATPLGGETRMATNRTGTTEGILLYAPYLVMRAAEGLHPLGLSFLSRWLAPWVEALGGYRALFILPNSWAVQQSLDPSNSPLDREVRFYAGIIPQLILGLLLAWCLQRNGKYRGLSPSARRGWVLAALFVGVPAYLTYELTRSRVALVTCKNCGRGRRSDREYCHHCQSAWENPANQVPSWRVLEAV